MPPKLSKETLVLLINIGITCPGKQNNPTLFEKTKYIATRIINKKIFLRPKDEVAVVLMGSSDTKNSLDTEHVEEYINFQIPNWNIIEKIMHLQPTKHCSNWVEALIATIRYIQNNAMDICLRKVIIMSDFNEGPDIISQFEIHEIVKELHAHAIELLTIGENVLNDEPESSLKVSEKFLKNLHKQINGHHITFDTAVSDMKFYVGIPKKGSPWYVTMELIDIKIPVVCYKVTETYTFSSWKMQNTEGQKVISKVQYLDRQRKIYDKEETVEGYKYGEKFIPVEKDLENRMSYKAGPKCYTIYCFTNKDNVDLDCWYEDSTSIVLPSNRDENVARPFYNLVQAMHNLNLVAIVRKVYKDKNSLPKMVALFPCIDVPGEPWCLVEISLPFAEDTRVLEVRPLKSVVKRLTNEQSEAVDNLLDSLLLPDTEDSEDVDESQYFLPGSVPNPGIQHMWHMLSYRALHPDKPLPPTEDYLKKVLEVPSVKENSKHHLQKIAQLFQLESIDPKKNEEDESTKKDDIQNIDKQCGKIVNTEDLFTEIDMPMDTSDVDLDELAANY